MDAAVETVLADYEKRFMDEAAGRQSGRITSTDDLSLPIGPEAGGLLNTLIKAMKTPTILELGTSNGYSTVWLAEAARASGGRVVTIEEKSHKQDYARAALTKAGLSDRIEFVSGDAIEVIKALPGPFDFVLVDLWKDLYVPCLDLFYPKLAAGALIAADNMIHPSHSRPTATAYRKAVRAKPNIQSILLTVGQGIELSRYIADLPAHLV